MQTQLLHMLAVFARPAIHDLVYANACKYQSTKSKQPFSERLGKCFTCKLLLTVAVISRLVQYQLHSGVTDKQIYDTAKKNTVALF